MEKQILHKCQLCPRKFLNETGLSLHMQYFHKKSKKNTMVNFKRVAENKCEICNQDFTHKRHHKKQKKFQCEICSKYFTQSSNLNVHVRTVHQKLKPHKCNLCKKAFGYRCHLNAHKNKNHWFFWNNQELRFLLLFFYFYFQFKK